MWHLVGQKDAPYRKALSSKRKRTTNIEQEEEGEEGENQTCLPWALGRRLANRI